MSNVEFIEPTLEELQSDTLPTGAIWATDCGLDNMSFGNGAPIPNETAPEGYELGWQEPGKPLLIGGIGFKRGISTHSYSAWEVDLHKTATRFVSMVGVDDVVGTRGSVTFQVLVDGKLAAETPVMRGGDKPVRLSVDLTGADRVTLIVTDGGDGIEGDVADWCGARFYLAGEDKPKEAKVAVDPARMKMFDRDPAPAIHGARVYGATPGNPFLYLIPATGDGPLTYSAVGLPAGLTLDSKTGIISGALEQDGKTLVRITVTGAKGAAHRDFTIIGGVHKLAQTPPMGWNSWYAYLLWVDEDKTKSNVDALVSTGLAGYGYHYVNLDDTWQGQERDANGQQQCNDKFASGMKHLADYCHKRGLKLGTYTSPGPTTCAGHPGSWGHELDDAATYAEWGIDFLKYDWCSYPDNSDYSKPYIFMRECLDQQKRDIVYSYCTVGKGKPWLWGAQEGGNLWRTSMDIGPGWGPIIRGLEMGAVVADYAGPGHWNDPDMVLCGQQLRGNIFGDKIMTMTPTGLTPNEQIMQISMLSLQAAPLLVSCDLTVIDDFTLAILTNDEVLDIDQDPLGKAAHRIYHQEDREIWSRPLVDETTAIGLLNRSLHPQTISVTWDQVGLPAGPRSVRDLWLHEDLGLFGTGYEVEVPAHGVVLIKVG